MAIVLYHHPHSRAAGVVWMLEEAGVDYQLHFVDFQKGQQKTPEMLAMNPMGKLPVLRDGDVVVTESAAIGLYLADRYASGRLAPRCEDPARGPYLRWSLFAPSVIEPNVLAKMAGWTYRESQAGWGSHDAMLSAIEQAIAQGPYLLGQTFSMADVIFGGTLRYMMAFKMIESRPSFAAYVERLVSRPAFLRAEARNAAVATEQGVGS